MPGTSKLSMPTPFFKCGVLPMFHTAKQTIRIIKKTRRGRPLTVRGGVDAVSF